MQFDGRRLKQCVNFINVMFYKSCSVIRVNFTETDSNSLKNIVSDARVAGYKS